MANSVYAVSNGGINAYSIQISLNSFKDHIDRTNQILNELGSSIVTTSQFANGAITSGNSYVNGVFTALTLQANTLSGGVYANGATANLNVTSNTVIANGTVMTFSSTANLVSNGSVTLNGINILNGNATFNNVLTSTANAFFQNNVVFSGNLSITSGVSISGNFANISANSINFTGNTFNITSNTTISGNTTLSGIAIFTGPNTYFASNATYANTATVYLPIATPAGNGGLHMAVGDTIQANTVLGTGILKVNANGSVFYGKGTFQDLSDFDNSGSLNGYILTYNSTTGKYVGQSLGGASVVSANVSTPFLSAVGNSSYTNASFIVYNTNVVSTPVVNVGSTSNSSVNTSFFSVTSNTFIINVSGNNAIINASANISGNLNVSGNVMVSGNIVGGTFTGTSNNSLNFGGQLPTYYTSNTNLGTYVGTLTSNNATNFNGQPATYYTANGNLGTYVGTLTSNNATNFNGQPATYYAANSVLINYVLYATNTIQTISSNVALSGTNNSISANSLTVTGLTTHPGNTTIDASGNVVIQGVIQYPNPKLALIWYS